MSKRLENKAEDSAVDMSAQLPSSLNTLQEKLRFQSQSKRVRSFVPFSMPKNKLNCFVEFR